MGTSSSSYKVVSAQGKEVGTVKLKSEIFGAPVLTDLVHAAVRWQRAKARAGTHSVLTRSNIIGGKKKPFKQKGTGQARAGSSVPPHWVGGAVVHGPTPRSYEFRFPRRMREQALASALSDKVNHGGLVVVDKLSVASGKTKDARSFLDALGGSGKRVLIIVAKDSAEESKFIKAARNLAKVEVLEIGGINTYSIVKAEVIVCSKDGIEQIEKKHTRTKKEKSAKKEAAK